jgi:hypothetical protein
VPPSWRTPSSVLGNSGRDDVMIYELV